MDGNMRKTIGYGLFLQLVRTIPGEHGAEKP